MHSGMQLDLIHIHGSCTDLFTHGDTLAQDARCIGGNVALQILIVLGNHLVVGAETACRDHHCLGVNGHLAAVLGGCFDAGCCTILHEDLLCGGVVHDLYAAVLQILLQDGDHVRAHRKGLALVIHRTVNTLYGSTAELGNIMECHAVLIQPVNGILRILAEGLHQLRIIESLAAHQGIQLEELHRIEIALRICLIGIILLTNRCSQSRNGLIVAVALLRRLQCLLHTGILAELIAVLILGLRCIHAAGCPHRVAAGHSLALHHDHGLARIGCLHGRDHTGTAGTDHDNVCCQLLVLALNLFLLHSHVKGCRIEARCGDRILYCLNDGIAGHGCAADRIHLCGVCRHNLFGNSSDRLIADALRLLLIRYLNGIDGVLGQGHLNGHVSVVSLCRTCDGHGITRCLHRCLHLTAADVSRRKSQHHCRYTADSN